MKGDNWMDIRSARLKGMSYTELSKKYHMEALRGIAEETGIH